MNKAFSFISLLSLSLLLLPWFRQRSRTSRGLLCGISTATVSFISSYSTQGVVKVFRVQEKPPVHHIFRNRSRTINAFGELTLTVKRSNDGVSRCNTRTFGSPEEYAHGQYIGIIAQRWKIRLTVGDNREDV